MNRRIFQRLIWKDAHTILILIVGALITIVAMNLLSGMFVAMSSGTPQTQMSLAYVIWLVFPMLVAFGAPAMLIGGEEESGSLAWLQTLPASWKAIAASKLIVAVIGVAVVGLVATACYLLQWGSLSDRWLQHMIRTRQLAEPFWAHWGFASAAGLALLLCSFVTAYLIRSPITALLAVVPLIIGVVWAVIGGGLLFVSDEVATFGDLFEPGLFFWMPFALGAVLAIAALLALTALVAWRRLEKPATGFRFAIRESETSEAFRPPRSVAIPVPASLSRPTPLRALLWQQFAPIRGPLVAAVLVAFVGLVMADKMQGPIQALSVFVAIGALFFIAALTFFSDSVRHRCQFLHDRGVSTGLIWLTRVVPFLLIVIGIFSLAVLVDAVREASVAGPAAAVSFSYWARWVWSWAGMWLPIGIAAFAMTQLVSQWSPRPALAFFAGPVFVCLAALTLGGLFVAFPGAIGVLLVSAAILFFASWRLIPDWLVGRTRGAYAARFLGYVAIATVLPYVLILGFRWATLPADPSAWRERIAKMELPTDSVKGTGGEPVSRVQILNDAAVRRFNAVFSWNAGHSDDLGQRIERELAATNVVGQHVTFRELLKTIYQTPEYQLKYHYDSFADNGVIFEHPPVYAGEDQQGAWEWQFRAVRVLLKWSDMVRRQAVVGNANFQTLQAVAEHADLIATRVLSAYEEQAGMTEELSKLVDRLPDPRLVTQSRSNSLVRSYRLRRLSESPHYMFAGQYTQSPDQWWFNVERVRSDRSIDLLTETVLDALADGSDFSDPRLIGQVYRLEDEAYLMRPGHGLSSYDNMMIHEWMEQWGEIDHRIQQLNEARRRFLRSRSEKQVP